MPTQLALFSADSERSIRVVAHPDPHVLEQELVARIEAARPAGSWDPVLVLVPTSLLARHLQRRLAQRRPAWLGVEILPFRGLVHRILDGADRPSLRRVSSRVLEAVLDGSVRRQFPKNEVVSFTRERPRSLASLLATLRDLREAGIPPAALHREARTRPERELAQVYDAYETALGRLTDNGLTDEAGLVAAASKSAAAHGERYRAVFVHGAYELVGMHLDLARAVGRASSLTVLLPVAPGAPGSAYGDAFARRHLLPPGAGIEHAGERRGGLLCGRLGGLYEEEAAFEPLPEGAVVFRHTQGAPAEVGVALRHALRSIEEGVPAVEIALVARSLAPYAATIEESMFDGSGEDAPCTTTLGVPLRRDPRIHDLLLLLRVLADDFPRAPTVELLRSPRMRWDALCPGQPSPRGDLADSYSRRAGLLGGRDEWTEDLPRWAGRVVLRHDDPSEEEVAEAERQAATRREHCERIATAVATLAKRYVPVDGAWSEHATRVETLLREALMPARRSEVGTEDLSLGKLGELLDEMRDLDRVAVVEPRVSFAEMLAWLERAVDETEVPLGREDRGGLRVLDAMQARGLTFRRVFLLGMQSDLFPRTPRQDPFLPDDLRRRLRERTGRPLGVKLEGEREERLLLSLLLGSAGERLTVSWQRADEAGRAASPSLALREIARLGFGRPDLDRVRESAERISSHPARRLGELVLSPGLLAPDEEDLLLALRSPNPTSALAALGDRRGDLAAGLRMVCATESFAARDLRWDGRVGATARLPETLSVTALQQLGRCPLQFFFTRVLRIRELEEEAGVYDIPLNEMGSRVHAVLESIYRRLDEEGLFAAGDADRLIERAGELLGPAWVEGMEDVERRRRRRLRLLWTLNAERWKRALQEFLERDLRGIAEGKFTSVELERDEVRPLDFGEGVRAKVSARFDRVLRGASATVVGDYKTSGRLYRQTDLTRMLRGEWLQVPVYWMLAGERARVELLGVGPWFRPEPFETRDRTTAGFSGFDANRAPCREGFLETVREVLALATRGSFPIHPGETCRWCSYRPSCRQNHPPTLEREAHAKDSAVLRDIDEKNTQRPTLARVRMARGEEDEERALMESLERSVRRPPPGRNR